MASAIIFIAMMALEFFYFRQLSGGLISLDLRFTGFTPDEGMAWLTALGRRGSEIIIVWHYLTFDLIFPALYSLTLISLILVAGQRLPRFTSMPPKAQALLSLTFVAPYMLVDYVQNIAAMRLLSDFLYANPDSLGFASALIVTRFALGTIPLVVIATLFVVGQRYRGKDYPADESEPKA